MYATKEGVVDVDLEEGMARGGRGTFSQAMCGMGFRKGHGRDISGITQDQLILNGPWHRKESNALNYFWLYFAFFIY